MKASALIGWLLLCLPFGIQALSTDRDQPIQVEADELIIDEKSRFSTYRGNVRLQQGSLHITAEQIVFEFDQQNNLQRLVITGKPATFRQINEQQQEVSGAADQLDFNLLKNTMDLLGNARFVSGQDIIESEQIRLDLDGSTLQAGVNAAGQGRVRMLIQPRSSAVAEETE